MKVFKYLWFLILPISAIVALSSSGIMTFAAVFLSFGIIPFLEFFFPKDESNLDQGEELALAQHPMFDVVLYFSAFTQFVVLGYYLWVIKNEVIFSLDFFGKTASMGMMCGVIGINVAHELGHRISKKEQFLAKALLLTSLYMHFFIEHNRGHHRNVSTPEDPSSARLGESVYAFWFRSIIFAYIGAWKLEAKRLRREGKSALHFQNEMLQFQMIQIAFLAAIYFAFGFIALVGFIIAASIGFLMLETVNYIEHYGLSREKVNEVRYEPAGPEHSWNSNHLIGRLLLFELSRHSDHHYQPNRKYQILRHFQQSPQMPTGYPGMMLLSLVPPLWFSIMHKHSRLNLGINKTTFNQN